MARNPLIPRTPGQQAVDRLLNQTIPQLIQNQQRKQEREEDIARADKIREENLAIDQERYNDRQTRLKEQDQKDLIANADGNFVRAQDAYGKGNTELGDTYLDKSFSQYNEAGKAAPFELETYKKTQVTNKNTRDKFQTLQNNFYLSKDPEADLTILLKHYEDNSDVLNYQTTIQPVLEHVLTNYSDPRYADVYDKVDFGALKEEVKAYSVYNAQMEYKPSSANYDSYITANAGKDGFDANKITDAQLKAHYYKQNSEQYKGAANTYFANTLAAHETTMMDKEKLESLSSFEQKRLDINFKNAGATAVFGDGRGYGDLSDAERKKVDKHLLDNYGFPGIEYAKTDDGTGGNGDDGNGDATTETERKTKFLTLSDKGYGNLNSLEKEELKTLAGEFGSADELRKKVKAEQSVSKAVKRQQNAVNRAERKFDAYAELQRRIDEGQVRVVGEKGRVFVPSDLRADLGGFSGSVPQVKIQLERQQIALQQAQDKLNKLQGN